MKTAALVFALSGLLLTPSMAQDTQPIKERVRILVSASGLRLEVELVDNQPTICRLEGRDLILESKDSGVLVATNSEGEPLVQVLRDKVVPTPEEQGELKLGIKVTQPSQLACEQLSIMQDHSLVITDVEPGSLSAVAGLKLHDIIIGLDDSSSASEGELSNKLKGVRPGNVLNLQVLRQGKRRTVPVKAERQNWISVNKTVPILSDLPMLGDLFRQKGESATDVGMILDVIPRLQESRNKDIVDELDSLSTRIATLELLIRKMLATSSER